MALATIACSPRADVVEDLVAATLTAQAPPTSALPPNRPTSTFVPTVIATTAAPPTENPTPVIEDTPTPDPSVLELGDLIHAETFGQAGAWAVGDSGANNVRVEGGMMAFTQKAPGTYGFRITGRQADDFYAQVSTQVAGPCRAADKYGLIFRLQDGTNYNVFLLDCERRFQALRVVGGALEALNDWTPDDVIDGGADAANVLGVRGRGSQLDFFVNDTLVHSAQDDRFRGGRFGVWVGAGTTTDFTVMFDDLELYSLPPSRDGTAPSDGSTSSPRSG